MKPVIVRELPKVRRAPHYSWSAFLILSRRNRKIPGAFPAAMNGPDGSVYLWAVFAKEEGEGVLYGVSQDGEGYTYVKYPDGCWSYSR